MYIIFCYVLQYIRENDFIADASVYVKLHIRGKIVLLRKIYVYIDTVVRKTTGTQLKKGTLEKKILCCWCRALECGQLVENQHKIRDLQMRFFLQKIMM